MMGPSDILQGSSIQGQHLKVSIVNCKLWHLLDSGKNERVLPFVLMQRLWGMLLTGFLPMAC